MSTISSSLVLSARCWSHPGLTSTPPWISRSWPAADVNLAPRVGCPLQVGEGKFANPLELPDLEPLLVDKRLRRTRILVKAVSAGHLEAWPKPLSPLPVRPQLLTSPRLDLRRGPGATS